MLILTTANVKSQDLPLIPVTSEQLAREVDAQNEWKKLLGLTPKLTYFSKPSLDIVGEQYIFNAKYYLLEIAISALFYPMKKLELQENVFESNFFELINKNCQRDLKTDFDWGNLVRQIYFLEKEKSKKDLNAFLRWDDQWSKTNFPIELQQRFYTARVTRSLDAIKALCIRETNKEISVASFFLQDNVLGQRFTSYLTDEKKEKLYCESSIFCRKVPHTEFVQRLPRTLLDLEFSQEMVGAWKTFIQDFNMNWVELKKNHQFLSMYSTQQAQILLHDEAIKVSDFFHLMGLMSKEIKNSAHDPILKSIKPVLDQMVSDKIVKSSQKVVWEEPLEIQLKSTPETENELVMNLKISKGGLDEMIDTIEKFHIKDSISFERGFLEWFLRATLNIRYYNEQLYWENRNQIEHHLRARFDNYVDNRKAILPYLKHEKFVTNLMIQWFFERRNFISEYLIKHPDQKVFSLKINHILGLSALETSVLSE